MENHPAMPSQPGSAYKRRDVEKYHAPSNAGLSSDSESGTTSRKGSFVSRVGACWCLILHWILSVGITVLVLICVDDHHFNVTERNPLVQVAGGTRVTQFFPTQSDVITFLSSTIAILKLVLSAWAASLCWNIALFLMERRGLTRGDLKALLKYSLLAPGTYSRDWPIAVIGVLLLATLVGHLSSPILTGSISWVPRNRLVRGLSLNPVEVRDTENGVLTELPSPYATDLNSRQALVMTSLGAIVNAWGSDPEKGVLKRVSTPLNSLQVNSTIDNIILPYFKVHSIRWIENRDEIPGVRDGVNVTQVFAPPFEMAPASIPSFPVGHAVLIPNVTTDWSNDPLDPTIIRDTRLLILSYGYDEPTRMWTLTRDLPSGAYILPHKSTYLAFAWVNFSAGVGRCTVYNCVIASPSIIRNNTPLELEPHQLTFQALSMALIVGVNLVKANMSLPIAWDNLDDYVEAVLARSYSGAWMAMNANFVGSGTMTAPKYYVPSVPSLLAQIDRRRIYIWLSIQQVVTALSVLFLVAQFRHSEYPLIGDTSLAAFDLDTTAIPVEGTSRPINRVRKIEPQGNKLTVKNE